MGHFDYRPKSILSSSPRCLRKYFIVLCALISSQVAISNFPVLYLIMLNDRSIRALFLSADVAQSVELGISMRAGTVNDVFHSLLKVGKNQVKDVLQYIDLQTNHRKYNVWGVASHLAR